MVRYIEKSGVKYLTFSHMSKYDNLIHAFTTRYGGVSEGCFESLNFGFVKGDKLENIHTNFNILAETLNIKVENMVRSQQEHTNSILYVTEKDRGKGVIKARDFDSIDGLITDRPDVAIITSHADCTPLFFYDYEKNIIGLAHSGWRGTASKIGQEMVNKFSKDFYSNPKHILVGIGPSIGPCCFEVDKDVYEIFANQDKRYKKYINKIDLKYHIDLWSINKLILKDNGIIEKNIVSADICTKCNINTYFSHRGQKGKRGTLIGIMMLKNLN